MAGLASLLYRGKKLSLLLNTSFLFLLIFYFSTHFHPINSQLLRSSKKRSNSITIFSSEIVHEPDVDDDDCSRLHEYDNYEAKCAYLKSEKGCQPKGYIDYLQIFYCICGQYSVLGCTILILWLVVLFYLLGNTAAIYFCYSLERLSRALNLSPTIAGVTLLALGNGAPDVFSSIVSFMGAGSGQVGLNGVLGGAFFISSTVVGVISISVSPYQVAIDRSCFIRDVVFFLLSLSSLLVIVIIGKINLLGATAFFSLYLVYVIIVSTTHCRTKDRDDQNSFSKSSTLAASRSFLAYDPNLDKPLLGYLDDDQNPVFTDSGGLDEEDDDQNSRTRCFCLDPSTNYFILRLLHILELPLYLPRRLTIPVVSEEKWSKPFGVISVTLSPILFAALCNSQSENIGSSAGVVIYIIATSAGIVLGILAFLTTEKSNPPKKFLLAWLAGGFLMSITWTYIIAEELVSLLVSVGHVFGISPSILAVTLLAWGNSLGDLIANVAMAVNNMPEGTQVAISGCYAGPIFNTLMGLGLSLVFSSWSAYPSSFIIPEDSTLYEVLGFLIAGLLWALVILPRKEMKLDRVLGGGLFAIYLCFLSLKLAEALGLAQHNGSPIFSKP
ncbi:PREDICTED: cation/calcium exchanger 1-like [Nelumbo nucifera]|uniref:Cation/calcium exchanger 1-like n=2 Tax=Nelumbo nucifera TaxID=4432 RepID=A0A1U7YWE3_NELNU|nr:PREDICTED: cation/calcium exchanger 1-like [Nelumbo nucifera]DAD47056.1 TPA_asm: hypothetical protein HUJ06_016993 [Nelumbo nucifera]